MSTISVKEMQAGKRYEVLTELGREVVFTNEPPSVCDCRPSQPGMMHVFVEDGYHPRHLPADMPAEEII